MESNGLETDEVVAGGHSAWNGCGPGRVVSNHLAVSPLAVVDGTRQETGFVNLEPLEGVRVDTSAGGTRALCEVGQLNDKSEHEILQEDAFVLPWDRWHEARLGSSKQ